MSTHPTLLPEGIYDLLPPLARQRNQLIQQLLDRFAHAGYDQVNPPLVEFEDTLLCGRGAALTAQTFRVMDPLSQRMLAFRPDMTFQVARIATTQLASAPRPLRLCYAGTTLLASGDPLQPGRQKSQAGIELFGRETPDADSEVIRLAVEALNALIPGGISVDLMLPGLVDSILSDIATLDDTEKKPLRTAIARKDATVLSSLPNAPAELLRRLIEAAGEAEHALHILSTLQLPENARAQLTHLRRTVELLEGCALTIDPVETRGFEYHHLLNFSLFSRSLQKELGRGGRYKLDTGEPAFGCTLYVGTLLGCLPEVA